MLTDRIVLVTGGTGAIGASICRACAGYGADIAFTYQRREAEAAALSAEIEQQGRRCMSARVSATDSAAIEEFCAKIEEKLGRIDVLVNNLGAAQVMPFALIEESDWDEMLRVNLTSMFLFSRAVARGMIRRKLGAIVNIGSVAGHRLLEVPVHYAAAKAGVSGFTKALAKELSRYGIRVNEVVPGLVAGGLGMNVSERQLRDYNQFCATGRPGKPEEVAELVAFVASERAAYVNAQSLLVDGGI